MGWLDDMKADAIHLAAPDFALLDGDEIHVEVHSSEGAELSSVTFEPAFFAIFVGVWRPVDLDLTERGPGGEIVFRRTDTGQAYIKPASRCYQGTEAGEFLTELMKLGSRALVTSPDDKQRVG